MPQKPTQKVSHFGGKTSMSEHQEWEGGWLLC